MEDVGISSPLQVEFKRLVYVEGIAACVDGGSWERLEPAHQIPGFDHTLVYRTGAGAILAQMWTSADGKGRNRYPMLACAEVWGWDLGSALGNLLPVLTRLRADCLAAASQDGVRQAVVRAQASADGLTPATSEPDLIVDGQAAARVSALLKGADASGLSDRFVRLNYTVDRDLATYIRGASKRSTQLSGSQVGAGLGPRHLRMPIGGSAGDDPSGGGLTMWLKFMYLKVDPGCPLMLIAPLQRPWVDVLVGPIAGSQMFCIRAGEQAIPIVTDVPYTLDPTARMQAQAFLSEVAGRAPEQIGQPALRAVAAASGFRLAGWKLALVVVMLLALLAAALTILLGAAAVDAQTVPEVPRPLAVQLSSRWESINAAAKKQDEYFESGYAGVGSQAQDRIRRLHQMLSDLDASLPSGVVAPSAQTAPWGPDFAGQVRRLGDQAIERALAAWRARPVDPADPVAADSIARAKREVEELFGRADRLAADMVRVESLLNQAFGVGEVPTGGDSIETITNRWASDGLAVDRGVRAALSPVLGRVDELTAIQARTDAAALMAVIRSEQSRPEAVLTAWRRLGSRPAVFWPVSREELEQELEADQRTRAATAQLPSVRRQAVEGELTQEQRRRIERFVAGSRTAEDFDAGMAALERLGIGGESLDPRSRFNALVRDFRRTVRNPGLPDVEAKAQARKFINDVRSLPGGTAFLRDAADAVVSVERVLDGESTPGAASNELIGLGPAATGVYIGRRLRVRIVFEARDGGPTLRFVVIGGTEIDGQPVAAFCLGVAEVSVETFASIHKNRDFPVKLAQILPGFAPEDDPRLGPRSWMWDERRVQIRPCDDWLTNVTATSADQYPPGAAPAPPGPRMPMQYLSPVAAAATAALAGCRLPTSLEWRAAVATLKPATHGPTVNLRDRVWEQQRAYVETCLAQRRVVQAADAGAFTGQSPERRESVAELDGTLWLAPVTPRGATDPTSHLVGNVWEYAVDSSAAEWAPFGRSPLDLRALTDWINDHPDRLGVIGASALSSPGLKWDQRQAVTPAQAAEGFSDVGFRLAFSAPASLARDPGAGLGARLDRALTPAPFLKPR